MDVETIRRRLDAEVRRDGVFSGRRVERGPRITRVIGPTPVPLDNLVFWSDLDDANADASIDEQVLFFRGLGHDFQWFVYGHDTPSDLVARLRGRGFQQHSDETVMVRDVVAAVEAPALPDGVQIRRLREPAQVADALAVQEAVWGTDQLPFLSRWLTELVAERPEEGVVLVAYEGERPVGSAWSTLHPGDAFVPLFGGSVLPDARGRGLYRAMVAERVRAAAASGAELVLVDAGPESAPILERLGFTSITGRTSLRFLVNRSAR